MTVLDLEPSPPVVHGFFSIHVNAASSRNDSAQMYGVYSHSYFGDCRAMCPRVLYRTKSQNQLAGTRHVSGRAAFVYLREVHADLAPGSTQQESTLHLKHQNLRHPKSYWPDVGHSAFLPFADRIWLIHWFEV